MSSKDQTLTPSTLKKFHRIVRPFSDMHPDDPGVKRLGSVLYRSDAKGKALALIRKKKGGKRGTGKDSCGTNCRHSGTTTAHHIRPHCHHTGNERHERQSPSGDGSSSPEPAPPTQESDQGANGWSNEGESDLGTNLNWTGDSSKVDPPPKQKKQPRGPEKTAKSSGTSAENTSPKLNSSGSNLDVTKNETVDKPEKQPDAPSGKANTKTEPSGQQVSPKAEEGDLDFKVDDKHTTPSKQMPAKTKIKKAQKPRVDDEPTTSDHSYTSPEAFVDSSDGSKPRKRQTTKESPPPAPSPPLPASCRSSFHSLFPKEEEKHDIKDTNTTIPMAHGALDPKDAPEAPTSKKGRAAIRQQRTLNAESKAKQSASKPASSDAKPDDAPNRNSLTPGRPYVILNPPEKETKPDIPSLKTSRPSMKPKGIADKETIIAPPASRHTQHRSRSNNAQDTKVNGPPLTASKACQTNSAAGELKPKKKANQEAKHDPELGW